MTFDRARERASSAANRLKLSEPVTIDTIQSDLERVRGRRIKVKPLQDFPDEKVCGLWFGLDDIDVIFHSRGTSELHRQQILLHEFAHIILRDEQEEVSPDVSRSLFPDLDPDMVVKALKRTDFLSFTEMAAELLADILAQRIRVSRVANRQPQKFGRIFG